MNIKNAFIYIPDVEIHKKSISLKIGESTLLDLIHARLESHFEKVDIIASKTPVEIYNDYSVIKNKAEALGMVSAIYTALNQVDANEIFLTSCLLPFITDGFIKFMKSKKGNLLVSSGDKICYQTGIYSRSILPLLNLIVEDNINAMKLYDGKKEFSFHFENFIDRIAAEVVDISFEKFYFRDLLFEIEKETDLDYVRENLF